MKYEYIIWHDNDFDLAFWVKDNSILKNKKVQLRCIPKTNKPSQIMGYFNDECTKTVMKYIRYETPDVIIQKIDGKLNPVVCVTELMTHTPQWQHPAQRFTRLYTSSILKTPTALIIPQRKIKWEKGSRSDYKATPYTCSPSVYQLFVSATNKNNTPTLIFNWPNFEGYLIYDEKHQTSPFIDEEISNWFDFINKCIEKDGALDLSDYESVLNKMKSRAEEILPEDFETIRGVSDTDSVIKEFNLDKSKLSSKFLSNKKTLVFAPNGLKCSKSKFRTDPYAGMLCAFDIMFCRDREFKRNINLLLIAKNVKKSEIQFGDNVHENKRCPFINQNIKLEREHLLSCSFTQAKYRRIYGEVADVIIFDDTIYYNGGVE